MTQPSPDPNGIVIPDISVAYALGKLPNSKHLIQLTLTQGVTGIQLVCTREQAKQLKTILPDQLQKAIDDALRADTGLVIPQMNGAKLPNMPPGGRQ